MKAIQKFFFISMFFAVTTFGSFAENTTLFELRVPDIYSTASVYLPYVAEDAGIFATNGIKVKFTGVIGPGQHLPSVVAGSNDVGSMMIDRTISGVSNGAQVTAVVAANGNEKISPVYEFDVLENSPIKAPKDLVGKKVGVLALGGPHTYPVLLWLKKAGIAVKDQKIQFVILPNIQQQEQALRAGQIDVAAFFGNPIEVLGHGGIRRVFTTYDAFGEILLSPYYFSNKFIAKNPKVVRSFVKAVKETMVWINAHPKEAVEISARHYKIDASKVNPPVPYTDTTGLIDEKLVQEWIDLQTEDGSIKKAVKVQDLISNSFNDGKSY